MKLLSMSRFKIDEPQEGLYIVEDTESGLLCTFERGKFYETQEYAIPTINVMKCHIFMPELCDWLAKNHRDKLF